MRMGVELIWGMARSILLRELHIPTYVSVSLLFLLTLLQERSGAVDALDPRKEQTARLNMTCMTYTKSPLPLCCLQQRASGIHDA